jgi:hypothetical protein
MREAKKKVKIFILFVDFILKISTFFLMFSQIWLNLPWDHHFSSIFLWMIATLLTNKNP